MRVRCGGGETSIGGTTYVYNALYRTKHGGNRGTDKWHGLEKSGFANENFEQVLVDANELEVGYD